MPVASCGNSDPRCPTHSPETNTVLAAAIATAFVATTHLSPAAKTATGELGNITSAMNSIPDIIFYKDMDGVYRGGNSAWAALAGKPLDQLIGKTDFDLFPADVADLELSRFATSFFKDELQPRIARAREALTQIAQ